MESSTIESVLILDDLALLQGNQVPGNGSLDIELKFATQPLPIPTSTKTEKPKPIKDSEWPELESLIRHLYIDENQDLKAVQQYLRNEKNLIATDKQLTNRFKAWNMKKNIKAIQRKRVLEVFQQDLVEPVTIDGLGRMTSRKQRQWRMEKSSLSTAVFQMHIALSIDHSNDMLEPEETYGQRLPAVEAPENSDINLARRSESTGRDILASLSNLLTKLGFKISDNLDGFVHNALAEEEPSTNTDCESVSCANLNGPLIRGTGISNCAITFSPGSWPRRGTLSSTRKSPLVWIDLNVDVDFPTGLWVDSSPYNELYPFPVNNSGKEKSGTTYLNSTNNFARLCGNRKFVETIEERLQKITKLRQVGLGKHLALTCEIYELAISYCHKKKVEKAIYWVRKITDDCLTSSGEMETLLTCSWVLLSYALWKIQKWQEASIANQKAQQCLLFSNCGNQKLTEIALVIGGSIASAFDHITSTESMNRQLIQISLTKNGPRHKTTLALLQDFGAAMIRQGRFSCSDQLLTLVKELGRTTFGRSDRIQIEITSDLAWLREEQRRYQDAESLRRMALDQAEKALGSNDSLTLDTERCLAQNLICQGKYTESEAVLRRSLEKRLELGKENSLSAAATMRVLGVLLTCIGNFEEAEIWLQKCFRIHQAKQELILGLTSICLQVVKCYEVQKNSSRR